MKMTMPIRFLALLAALALSFAGCATKPTVNWDSRLGTFTYDEAVIELGPPDRQAQLDSGGKVAEWVVGRSGRSSVSLGLGSFGRHTGVGISQTVGSGGRDKVLQLTFGDDNRLMEWKRK